MKKKNLAFYEEEEVKANKKNLEKQVNLLSNQISEINRTKEENKIQSEKIEKEKKDITIAAKRIDTFIQSLDEKQKGINQQNELLNLKYDEIEKMKLELQNEKMKIEQQKNDLKYQTQNIELLKMKLNNEISLNQKLNNNNNNLNNTFSNENYLKQTSDNYNNNNFNYTSNETQFKPNKTTRFFPSNKLINVDEYFEKVKKYNKSDKNPILEISKEKEFLRKSKENFYKTSFK